MHEAAGVVRELGADYVKIWPGQDGWDYPFQVDHRQLWKLAVDGMRELAGAHPDLKFAIEYKPREPRVKMTLRLGRPHPARHPADRPRQRRHPARLRPQPLRRRIARRRRPADHRPRPALRHGRQRQPARLGRRPRGRHRAPDRDLRVLPRPAQEQLGRRLATRPVPVPRGQRRRGDAAIGTLKRIHRALDRLDVDALAEAQHARTPWPRSASSRTPCSATTDLPHEPAQQKAHHHEKSLPSKETP